MSKQERNTLSYGEGRQVELLVRRNWKANDYVEGQSDETVAEEATKLLGRVVKVSNVRWVRHQVGLCPPEKRVRHGGAFTAEDLQKLEEGLLDHDRVVVRRGPKGLWVQGVETFLETRTRIQANKPWLKSKHVVKHAAANGVQGNT